MTNKNTFICSDGHKLSYNLWLPAGEPKAFIQILHGMAEYSDRYERFALYLNSLGFAVFAQDHRGHGSTAGEDELGWFCENDGWNRITLDAYELADEISELYKCNTMYLFGHSMGSFIARTLMVKYPGFYSAVIVMGTAAGQGIVGKIGKLICKMQIKKNGQKALGTLMNKLSFGAYNKAFEPTVTDYDWLSRDIVEVEKYVSDPLCGFVCTNGFFYDLLTGIEFANDCSKARLIQKDLPVLLISGDNDPVGAMGKGIEKVYKMYKKAGLTDITLKLVPGARHELLNETDRQKTYKFIADWLENN